MSEQEPIRVVVKPQVLVKRGGPSCCGCSCAIPTLVIPVAALALLASSFGSALALLLRRHFPQGYCRFDPSCSEYTRQAIER